MHTYSKNSGRISLLLILLCLSSCFGKNEHDVNFFFPNASVNGFDKQILTKIGADDSGNPLSPSQVAKIDDSIFKEFFGGSPVEGTFTTSNEYIEYKPLAISSLMRSGDFYGFKIPYKDIRSVKADKFAVVSNKVTVTTDYGVFVFQLLRSMPWSDENKEIETEIAGHLNR